MPIFWISIKTSIQNFNKTISLSSNIIQHFLNVNIKEI